MNYKILREDLPPISSQEFTNINNIISELLGLEQILSYMGKIQIDYVADTGSWLITIFTVCEDILPEVVVSMLSLNIMGLLGLDPLLYQISIYRVDEELFSQFESHVVWDEL